MFDMSVNDFSVENSGKNNWDSVKKMASQENNKVTCPTVLTGMSHEMRTHMNAIVAFAFMMKENGCNYQEREEFSNQILSSCEQLIGLFDSFFDSAIIDTGNSNADSKLCKLNNLFDDLLPEFREIMKKDSQKQLELVTEIQYSNSSEVFIDKNRVQRVIRSLFQNSIKSTKSGYIKIGHYFRDDQVNFYVLDSGHGYLKCKEFLHTTDLNKSLEQYNDMYTAINIILARKLIQVLGGIMWIECNGLTGTGMYFSVPSRMATDSDINIHNYVKNIISI